LSLTLLVENNPRIESFYMLNLSTWLGLEIVAKQRAEFAIKLLEAEAAKIGLIIVRAVIDGEETAKLLVDYVQKKDLKIPIIEIGPGKEVPGCFAHVPNSLQLKILIQSAAKALNITAKDMSQKVVPDRFPIPITYFKVIKRSVCPVYSQDVDDPNVFHLRFGKLEEFEESKILALIEEGVTHLYVDKLDRLEFVNNVTSELMSLIDGGDLSVDEQISATDKSMELLSKKLLTIGVNEETIKLANKNLDTLKKNVKANPKMSKLLERLLANRSSYLFKHTQILTYICMHIIKNIDWGNTEQEEKISFIAFFHDIALESDEQAKIKSTLELKKAQFTPQERSLVERHAQLSAELVSKFPHAPMGADQIIRQHHGTLNGVGFSEHYGNNVSPIAVVFIVAEEFTRIIMARENGPFDRPEMLRELKEEFPTSRFQKVIDLLQTITF
jgi:HD-GYP domain-containing protein (c-di-GMP phosphodiesterase class II)